MKTLKYFLVSVLTFYPFIIANPQCSQLEIDQKEYSWKKDPDAVTDRPGPANLSGEQAIIKKFIDIAAGYCPKPKGGEIFSHGYFDGRIVPGQYPKGYEANIVFKRYLCTNGKVTLIPYSSSVFIGLNSLLFMGNEITMNGKTYTTLFASFINKDGYFYYPFDVNDRDKTEEEWILTYNGKLPFSFLSRKDYVIEARADQQKVKDAKNAEIKKNFKIRSKAEQDAEKQRFMDGFRKSYQGDALNKRLEQFDHDYKTDQQKYDEAMKFNEDFYGKILKKYDDFILTHNEAYLSQPAIILPYSRQNFDGFDGKSDPLNSVYILKNDPSYYKTSLGVTTPQYITVLIRHPRKGDTDALFYNAFNRKEFLDTLASLLGKQ
jgi:hypothetical protein